MKSVPNGTLMKIELKEIWMQQYRKIMGCQTAFLRNISIDFLLFIA